MDVWRHSVVAAAADIADALGDGLARASSAVELQQDVRGLDTLDELAHHRLLADALRTAGYGAHPEVRYPSARVLSRRNHGLRCDLVVTPEALALDEDAAQASLFRPARVCSTSDALWLEVKVARQHDERGPSRGYDAFLRRPVLSDVQKLASDPGIERAAVLLVLYTATREGAERDVLAWAGLARGRALPVEPPEVRRLPIGDRHGNALCTAALFPLALHRTLERTPPA